MVFCSLGLGFPVKDTQRSSAAFPVTMPVVLLHVVRTEECLCVVWVVGTDLAAAGCVGVT
eukprot:3782564-Rhodomonas_salina.1